MRTTNPAKAKSMEVTEKVIFPDATEQITKGHPMRWTANKLLKGAGAGADPTEIEASGVLGIKVIRKTSGEIVNNSTALQDDDELFFAVGALERWAVDVLLRVTSSAVADFKYQWVIPAGGDLLGFVGGFDPNTAVGELGMAVEKTILTDGNPQIIVMRMIYRGGVNAGNIQLQWAQNTAEVSDTIVQLSSYIITHKIG